MIDPDDPDERVRWPDDCARTYRPIRTLATGGFGAVVLADQVDLGRRVVVKVLLRHGLEDPDQRRRFVQEARIGARLRHPNVVGVLDFGIETGDPWIAMEYVEGGCLRDRITAGPLPVPAALECVRQLVMGLQAAHDQGILHRDLKPENVLVDASGCYRLVDFGIAKWRDGEEVRTRTGVIFGTPAYLPPERIRGEPAGPPSDLYAVGAMLFEMVTGRQPFEGRTPMDVAVAHLERPVPVASGFRAGVPESVDRLIGRLMAKDPEDRPRSCAELLAALPPGTGGPDGPAPSAGRGPPGCLGGGRAGRSATRRAVAPAGPDGEPVGVHSGGRLSRAGSRAAIAGIVTLVMLGLVGYRLASRPPDPESLWARFEAVESGTPSGALAAGKEYLAGLPGAGVPPGAFDREERLRRILDLWRARAWSARSHFERTREEARRTGRLSPADEADLQLWKVAGKRAWRRRTGLRTGAVVRDPSGDPEPDEDGPSGEPEPAGEPPRPARSRDRILRAGLYDAGALAAVRADVKPLLEIADLVWDVFLTRDLPADLHEVYLSGLEALYPVGSVVEPEPTVALADRIASGGAPGRLAWLVPLSADLAHEGRTGWGRFGPGLDRALELFPGAGGLDEPPGDPRAMRVWRDLFARRLSLVVEKHQQLSEARILDIIKVVNFLHEHQEDHPPAELPPVLVEPLISRLGTLVEELDAEIRARYTRAEEASLVTLAWKNAESEDVTVRKTLAGLDEHRDLRERAGALRRLAATTTWATSGSGRSLVHRVVGGILPWMVDVLQFRLGLTSRSAMRNPDRRPEERRDILRIGWYRRWILEELERKRGAEETWVVNLEIFDALLEGLAREEGAIRDRRVRHPLLRICNDLLRDMPDRNPFPGAVLDRLVRSVESIPGEPQEPLGQLDPRRILEKARELRRSR